MTIRAVTAADEGAIRELWEAFEAEVPEPPGFQPETLEEAWADLSRHAREGVALLAEDESGAAGYAFATALLGARSHVTDVYVRPDARHHGLATDLMRELAAGLRDLGAEWVSADVLTTNSPARACLEQLGFSDVQTVMAASLATLEQRAGGGAAVEPSSATRPGANGRPGCPRGRRRALRATAVPLGRDGHLGAAQRLDHDQRRRVDDRAAAGAAAHAGAFARDRLRGARARCGARPLRAARGLRARVAARREPVPARTRTASCSGRRGRAARQSDRRSAADRRRAGTHPRSRAHGRGAVRAAARSGARGRAGQRAPHRARSPSWQATRACTSSSTERPRK